MRDKRCKYPGVDIGNESAIINNAIEILPKIHKWGSVKISTTDLNEVYGNAQCIDCHYSIFFDDGKWNGENCAFKSLKVCDKNSLIVTKSDKFFFSSDLCSDENF